MTIDKYYVCIGFMKQLIRNNQLIFVVAKSRLQDLGAARSMYPVQSTPETPVPMFNLIYFVFCILYFVFCILRERHTMCGLIDFLEQTLSSSLRYLELIVVEGEESDQQRTLLGFFMVKW